MSYLCTVKYILVILFLLGYWHDGLGQISKTSEGKSQVTIQSLLKSAKSNQHLNPSQSITDLDQLINLSKDKGDIEMLVEAYAMLGQINEHSGLTELAIKRYDQAIQYGRQLGKDDLLVSALYQQGVLLNQLKSPRAISVYSDCIDISEHGEYYTKCYEGLGLAYLNVGTYDKAKSHFEHLEKNYYQDRPIDLSRIQAYLTQVALVKEDTLLLRENYRKSRANYVRAEADEADYEIVDQAYDAYGQQLESLDEEISVYRDNVDINKNLPESQTKEQVQLADAYIRKGDLLNAEVTIKEAKKNLVKSKSSKLKADVYKTSSEILSQKGQYAQALEDYKKFEKQQSLLLDSKEKELQSKIDLLELQKSIDISENVYSSKVELGRSKVRVGNFQRYIIYLLCLLLAMALFGAWWISKSLRVQHIANKQLELKSLRGQMNPHFIFNALNSVNEFIATQDQRKANAYLSQFSKLMRSVLDVNMKDLIPLSEELALTKNYLELEHARFSEKFDYNYEVEPALLHSDLTVPPLLLQPYIENAVWHGLRYLEGKGRLSLTVRNAGAHIEIIISDNGIGRTNSQKLKTKHQKKHKSTGLKNTSDRIEIIKSLYAKQVDVEVSDLNKGEDNTGTRVLIKVFDL